MNSTPEYRGVEELPEKICPGRRIPLLTSIGTFATNMWPRPGISKADAGAAMSGTPIGRHGRHLGGQTKMKRTLVAPAAATVAREPRLRRQDRRVDGQVRRQLPHRAAQRHGRLRQDVAGRDAADRGRQGRRLQATQPGSELHRQRVDAIIVNPGRHLRHRRDHQGRRRRRRAARLCQSRAGRRRQARARRPRSSPPTKRNPGTYETQAICKLLGGKGDILVIEGQLSNQAAVQRTADIHDVIATPECKGMKIIAEQTAEWDRTKART